MHVPFLGLANHANPADMKPTVLDLFAIVDPTRKLGDAIGRAGALAGSPGGAVHGIVDLVFGGAVAQSAP
jgi:hypothetical protein